jgi:hypothetical protein
MILKQRTGRSSHPAVAVGAAPVALTALIDVVVPFRALAP